MCYLLFASHILYILQKIFLDYFMSGGNKGQFKMICGLYSWNKWLLKVLRILSVWTK